MRPGPCLYTLALLALGACTKQNTPGRVSFALHDCDTADAACAARAPELIEAPAFVTRQGSRFGAGGMVVEAQALRQSGVTAVLLLDFAPGQDTVATYTEWSKGARVFNGAGVSGRVVMGPDLSGRFVMRFVDPGPDGQRGTADDRVRSLLDGAFWRSPQVTTTVGPLPYLDLWPNWIDVVETSPGYDVPAESSGCGGAEDSAPPETDPAQDPTTSSSSGCGGSTANDPGGDSSGAPSDSSSGCGSDTSSSGSSSDSSSGCGSDTSSSGSSSDSSSGCGSDSSSGGSSSDSSSGCGSDSSSGSSDSSSGCGGSSSDSGSSGCGGDSSSASGCSAEQRRSTQPVHARRRGGGAGGRFYPAFAVAFLIKVRPRRKRAPAQGAETAT
jgi:hypothetical protein